MLGLRADFDMFAVIPKALLFVIAVAMIVGGLWWPLGELFIVDIIYFKFVIGSTILMALGVYLPWDDFMKHGRSP
jgi:hypothetical protein